MTVRKEVQPPFVLQALGLPTLAAVLVFAWSCGSSEGQQAANAAVSGEAAGGAGGVGAQLAAAPRSAAGRSSAGVAGSGASGSAAAAGSGNAGAAAGSTGVSAPMGGAGAGGAAGMSLPRAGALAPAAGSGGAGPVGAALPKVTDTAGPGPFKTAVSLRSGPKGQSGVFRPEELGKDGLLHPVFVWGCGGQASPSSYMAELTAIASHGFVVIAEVSNIGDDGAPLLAALAWAADENERSGSELFHKLNLSRIGLGGHSIGSVNSFIAGPDPRWHSTLHVAGGSLDNVNDPSAPTTGKGGKSLVHPTAYICSENDIFGNVEKTEKDYENTTAPVFFTIMAGTEHIGAVGDALPVIIAWLRWQLGDEAERRADFLDAQGVFATGTYSTRAKNW